MIKIEFPTDVRFSPDSATNYRRALVGSSSEFPIIVITSCRPGSGKTRLARRFLIARFGTCERSYDFKSWLSIAPGSISKGYVFLDDLSGRVTCRGFAEFQKLPSPPQLILCGNSLKLPKEMAAIATLIELE